MPGQLWVSMERALREDLLSKVALQPVGAVTTRGGGGGGRADSEE